MNNLDKKVIIFDFDGVFVDDFDFHKSHIEEFLGIEIDDEAFYEIHSGNVYKDDGVGLELGNFDAKKYCQKIHDELVKLPIVDGMDRVALEAVKIGESFIVSSGCEDNIRNFFKEKNICENLCTVYGVETNPSKEKKFEKILQVTGIKPDNAIFVTDTLGDILEANSLNIASIAVTWGFQRIETLEQGVPFGFAHSAEDVKKLIKEYFGY
jgi:phosphoglycolate phosphatase